MLTDLGLDEPMRQFLLHREGGILALVWGTVVMGVTGFVLWVPTIVGEWAPIYLIRVCEIIHFYEVILATLGLGSAVSL
jgi:cytochrome b subunit of formate dehydrogenase